MKDVGRVSHAGVHKDVNMALSTENDQWPVSLQVRMCPPKRPSVKDTPRWNCAAMNDDSFSNEFRVDLQNTLVARPHELDGAGRLFQRLHVLNDIVRGVGRKHFLSLGAVRASNGVLKSV